MDISNAQLVQITFVNRAISLRIQKITNDRSLRQQKSSQVIVDLFELEIFWTNIIPTKDAASLKIYYTTLLQKLRSFLTDSDALRKLKDDLWYIKNQVERVLAFILEVSNANSSSGLKSSFFLTEGDVKKIALQKFLVKFSAKKLEQFKNMVADSKPDSQEAINFQNQAKAAIAVLAAVMSHERNPQQMGKLPSTIDTLFTEMDLAKDYMIHANLCLINNRLGVKDCTKEYDPSKLSNWFNEQVSSFSSKGKQTREPLHKAIKGMFDNGSIDSHLKGLLSESKKYLPENIVLMIDPANNVEVKKLTMTS